MSIIPNINNKALQLLPDIALWKQQIADAIKEKGGNAEPTQAFSTLAEDIKDIPNFNTNGCEYINEYFKPTTLLEGYYNRSYLKSVVDNYIEEISGDNAFNSCSSIQNVQMQNITTISGANAFNSCSSLQNVQMPNIITISGNNAFMYCSSLQNVQMQNIITISGANAFMYCSSLQNVQMPNLTTISGDNAFMYCSSLQNVQMPNLTTISGDNAFNSCSSLQNVQMQNLTTIKKDYAFNLCSSLQIVQMPNLNIINGRYTFISCTSLQSVLFGYLTFLIDPFYDAKPNLRNITIGQYTNIDIPFNNWLATNVINEGQSGIDELNSNLYNNLLTKLYDHSNDGETRTLRLGWLDYVSEENIAYATAKGWTLTT